MSLKTEPFAPCGDACNDRRRLRVMQVITKLDMGGAEVVALDLTSNLHDRFEFAIATILDTSPSGVGRSMRERLSRLGVPIFAGTAFGFKNGGVLHAAWCLRRAVIQFQPDVVHLHTEMPELTWTVASMVSRRLHHPALVRTVHNSELWISWTRVGRWVTDRLADSTAIAVSNAAREADFAINTRQQRSRSDVIYNGVAETAAVPNRANETSHDRTLKVLFAGRLIEQKAPDLLPAILATAYEATHRRNVHVRIAGAGPLEGTVRAGLQGIAPEWTIETTPPIEGLQAQLQDYDVVLMPSRYEGFGLLALETLLAGVPLVATHAPGLIEVLPDGYPLCTKIDDATALGEMLALVLDDADAARMTVGSYREGLAQRFSLTKMADGYAKVYTAANGSWS